MMYLIMRGIKWKLLTIKTKIMSDKTKHTYEDTFKIDVKYTYDRKHNKVYDIQSIKESFNLLLKKLKR